MSSPDPPLVIITGGEGDLAAALAETFSAHGYRVEQPGRKELDVACADSVASFFADREGLEVLINNAGITADALIGRLSEDHWDTVLDTNLKGAHLCSQAAARLMARRGRGHLIQLGSFSALQPPLGQTAYAAAKAGLIGLTKSYAKEFGAHNIRVNCILPGFLETRMTAGLSAVARTAALDRHALRRFNTRSEAARFIHFLTTTENISGQVFQLDSRA